MKNGFVFLFAGILLVATLANANQNKGPEMLELNGGSRGKVPLPHLTHQKALKDCNTCHQIFPQKAGSIQALKAEGKLKKKQVMNKLCIKCHRAEKKAQRPSGPTKCADCHVR